MVMLANQPPHLVYIRNQLPVASFSNRLSGLPFSSTPTQGRWGDEFENLKTSLVETRLAASPSALQRVLPCRKRRGKPRLYTNCSTASRTGSAFLRPFARTSYALCCADHG